MNIYPNILLPNISRVPASGPFVNFISAVVYATLPSLALEAAPLKIKSFRLENGKGLEVLIASTQQAAMMSY